ncbi:MAG: AMP-binding protein, partial [Pseudomonadota bacterium]
MPEPVPPCRTLPEIIERQALEAPKRTALWWESSTTSFGELQDRIQRLAGALAASGQAGDRVAVLAWNCPAFITLIYAVPAAGQVLVPLNARLAPAEWCDQLQRSGASRLFADPELLATLEGRADLPDTLETIALGT